jgi:hypothetical protein
MSNAARQEDFHDGEDVAILPPEAPWDVAFIVGLLEQAGRGQNTAWALSNPMSRFRNVREASELTLGQRDKMLRAAALAHAAILDEVPIAWWEHVTVGMAAFAALIVYRAEDDTRRLTRTPYLLDMYGHARILENLCWNMSIAYEIADRAYQRAATDDPAAHARGRQTYLRSTR